MRRQTNRIQIQTAAKPFADFLAKRHVMAGADLDVVLMCGIGHGQSNRLIEEVEEIRKTLAASGYKASFHDCRVRTRVSQTGCGEIRPDLLRAIRGATDLQPISLGQRRDLARCRFGSKSRQGDNRHSEEQKDRQG
jgi:hypothetical protein